MDKYYTKSSIAKHCCKLVKKYIPISYHNDIIIEPSAGNGSFIDPIKSLCANNIFLDIKPEHRDVIKANYLTMNFFEMLDAYKKIHVIGNPPFGFKASAAIKFIKKSCAFCDTFSFILPRSFEKKSMKNSIPLHFHLIHSEILQEDAFVIKNMSYNVPCIFQIWEKRSYKRQQSNPKINAENYSFTKKYYEADFAVRRVGSKAGHIYKDGLNLKNANSHYFIKLQNKSDIHKIKNIRSKNKKSVTGPMSISKYDITKILNKMLA